MRANAIAAKDERAGSKGAIEVGHFFGTRFMPHLGQRPGDADVTSGCIGQA